MVDYNLCITDADGDELLAVGFVEADADADHLEIAVRAVLDDRVEGVSPIMHSTCVRDLADDLRALADDLDKEADESEEPPF